MKHIKTFEDIKPTPKIGDYILCKRVNHSWDRIFLSENIGQIVGPSSILLDFLVKYDIDLTKYSRDSFQLKKDPDGYRNIEKSIIEYFSPNRNDLEAILDQRKFNI